MYLIFDTETTDIPNFNGNPEHSKARIVQLACILLSSNFKEKASFSSLIKLDNDVEISPGAQNAHGITKEDCELYGIPITDALGAFDAFAERAFYIAAHNLKFDTFLLSTELIISGRPLYNIIHNTSGICTMLASTKVCNLRQKSDSNKLKWPKLQESAKILLGIEMTDAHDALYDCRICGKVLQHLIENKHISILEPRVTSQT